MPNLKNWGDQELLKLRNDMDRLFDSLCSDLGLPCIEDEQRSMSLEEDACSIVLRAALPGFEPEMVQVEVHERSVIIEGRKRHEQPRGVQSRTLRRKLALPCLVRPEQASASFEDGVLEVRMPKDTTCKPSMLRITRP